MFFLPYAFTSPRPRLPWLAGSIAAAHLGVGMLAGAPTAPLAVDAFCLLLAASRLEWRAGRPALAALAAACEVVSRVVAHERGETVVGLAPGSVLGLVLAQVVLDPRSRLLCAYWAIALLGTGELPGITLLLLVSGSHLAFAAWPGTASSFHFVPEVAGLVAGGLGGLVLWIPALKPVHVREHEAAELARPASRTKRLLLASAAPEVKPPKHLASWW